MKILVINSGSSSVKYELFDMDTGTGLAEGQIEAIGTDTTFLAHIQGKKKIKIPIVAKDHTTAINEVLAVLTTSESSIINNKDEISAVGHRIVHGGEFFTEPVIVNDEVKRNLENCYDIAPLHTTHHVKGILAIEKLLPKAPQVLVFDTAFHKTIPEYAFLYALPYKYYQRFGIRKYGFHGISNQYISERLSQIVNIPLEKLKIINCHLGNGSSITAVNYGKAVDTSMGFTPLEGLIMGTRCGDIDPSIPMHLMARESLKPSDIQAILNNQSGVLGITGISSDMRSIIKKSEEGDGRAKLAINMFCYRAKKYISSYIGVLNGCDYIIFSAGIGERSPLIRKKILSELDSFGIILDDDKNSGCISCEGEISSEKSKIKIFVIPTNEAIVIAKQTKKLIDSSIKNM
ncbi:MAG: acetate kinase [Elusimicrobia bacterium RIFOXYC2_FULL_34_12]|nr:MAG: acetate kinase [Elusimicrobia bacterium RIFOXYC2_FULL_34_12]OGS38042.1 MAG: acetate kinase [Elusimicrobia bacterium RIFOXYD2_FULL_34_30]HAM39304.1 acetate kinase [Elusimicrobiota bacterium]